MSYARYQIGRIVIWPIESMQSVIAVCLFLFGLFLISPIYTPSAEAIASADWLTKVLLRDGIYGILFILPTLSTFAGWFSERFRTSKWRARACFWMFISITFVTLLRVLILGLNPPIWLFYLGMGFVSCVCYLHWKVN